MSYCKIGEDSDVSMFEKDGEIVCSTCKISKKKPVTGKNGKTHWVRPDHKLSNRTEALKHLLLHHVKGHKVPNTAIKKLQDEIKQFGSIIK